MLSFDFDKIQHEILIKIFRGDNHKYNTFENWEINKATEDLI